MENKRKNIKPSNSGRKNTYVQNNKNLPQYRNEQDFLHNGQRNGTPGMRKVNQPGNDRIKNYNSTVRIQNELTEPERNRKIERRRKQERLKRQRVQALIALCAAAAVAVILIFMTPIFNIREIRLDGAYTIPKDAINAQIGDLVGSNIFSTSASRVEKKMCELPQIDTVEVKKHIFPSCLEVFIKECKPAAYLVCNNKTVVIDSSLQIIDDSGVFDIEKIPSISGVSISEYELNTALNMGSEEKRDAALEMLQTFETTGLNEAVTNINLDDLAAIKFNYDNRIEVLCGSQLQLERKIRMFAETTKTETINESSIGTMDLSVPGKAVYNP